MLGDETKALARRRLGRVKGKIYDRSAVLEKVLTLDVSEQKVFHQKANKLRQTDNDQMQMGCNRTSDGRGGQCISHENEAAYFERDDTAMTSFRVEILGLVLGRL